MTGQKSGHGIPKAYKGIPFRPKSQARAKFKGFMAILEADQEETMKKPTGTTYGQGSYGQKGYGARNLSRERLRKKLTNKKGGKHGTIDKG